MKRCMLLAVVCLMMGALPLAAQEKKTETKVERDLVYGKGGGKDLLLDLALPKEGNGPFAVVVCVHGGGWRGGKRQDMAKTIEVLANRGFVAATVSYRLTPDAQFPAQIEDCKAAVRWLRANANKYKINPDRVGAAGYSAGAHLACLLGTTEKEDGLEGNGGNPGQSSRVQAVVSFFGPTDFSERTWNADVEKNILVPFLGGSFTDKPEAYKKASPANYVRKTAPPFLFFHGTEDKIVNVNQSRLLNEKLQKAGASAKLVELEGEGHGWKGMKLVETIDQMLTFFDENLKK